MPSDTKIISPQKYLHIFALAVLGISQPLLGTFSNSPEFFVAWKFTTIELAAFSIALFLLPPLTFIIFQTTARLAGQRCAQAVYYGLFFILSLLAIYTNIHAYIDKHVITWVTSGIAAACLLALTLKSAIFSRFLGQFAYVTPLFLIAFIFPFASNGQISWGNDTARTDPASERSFSNPVPVVLIVLDALPAKTLLDGRGNIDAGLFPNIAGFSSDSVRYIDALAPDLHTVASIPKMLSGLKKTPRGATYQNYDDTLFSLLSPDYKIIAYEAGTAMCEPGICVSGADSDTGRLAGVLFDIAFLYSHLLDADSLGSRELFSNRLHDFGNFHVSNTNNAKGNVSATPDISRRFAARRAGALGDITSLIEDITQLSPTDATFIYFHSLLTHDPFDGLPQGKFYSPDNLPGLTEKVWDSDWLALQGYQRHILQVTYVDKFIGEILDALKKNGLYDESMIILTSDHGVSFRGGSLYRYSHKDIHSAPAGVARFDMFRVPLIIKYPKTLDKIGISPGEVSGLDLVPTILDVLEADFDIALDGHSVVENPIFGETDIEQHFSVAARRNIRRTKLRYFSDNKIDRVFKVSRQPWMIGREIDTLPVAEKNDERIQLVSAITDLRNFDGDSPYQSIRVDGTVINRGEHDSDLDIAIAVNEKICATTQTYNDWGKTSFYALINPACLNNTHNQIEFYGSNVCSPENCVLRHIPTDAKIGIVEKGKETLQLSDGRTLTRIPAGDIKYWVDDFSCERGRCVIRGWAVHTAAPADLTDVHWRSDEDFEYATEARIERAAVANLHGGNGYSGFKFDIPEDRLDNARIALLFVFPEGYFLVNNVWRTDLPSTQ
ncbi:MAG: sulfatase-like hydrolase/transferase [Halieaceae bacterium]|nr:sulfatase-like hydrolase/transferase [Halieaceae bacterium]